MNYPRRNYEMTEADLEKILDACKPVPYIMIGNIPPSSPQERANRAWAELGNRMGFDSMTVEPTGKGDRFFSAVPLETPEDRAARLAKEAEEKRLSDICTIKKQIDELQEQLKALENKSP